MKKNNQKGFTLIQAVFILVVLGLLGMVMVRLIGVQTSTGVLALQGARAYHAARSGLEWGAARVLNGGADCADIEGILIEDFEGVDVEIVECKKDSDIKEGADTYSVYTLESKANFGVYGAPDYVSRRVQIKFMVEQP